MVIVSAVLCLLGCLPSPVVFWSCLFGCSLSTVHFGGKLTVDLCISFGKKVCGLSPSTICSVLHKALQDVLQVGMGWVWGATDIGECLFMVSACQEGGRCAMYVAILQQHIWS